jgi:large subunit ribosomal protein L4
MSIDVRRQDGSVARSIELEPTVFGIEPNVHVMHQVVTAQLAAGRAGTQSTLTRAEVRGGGRKPWRQKGTGRARQGSTRAPHWAGGGVTHAPKPRDYRQKTPKKMVQLALRSALSDRAAEGKVAVVEAWDFAVAKTREAKAALAALGLDGKVLVVATHDDETVWKSFRNLTSVQMILASELNAYDVLVNDWIVFTEATLPGPVAQKADRPAPEAVAPTQTSAPVEAPETTTEASTTDATPETSAEEKE